MPNLTSEQLLEIRKNPNMKKFMNVIGSIESNNQYNVMVGGKKFRDFSAHPNQVGMRTKEGASDAAGRYQFLNTTFQGLVRNNPQAEINDFSPLSQDKAFILLLDEQEVLPMVLEGGYGHTKAIERLGKQFASLPSSEYDQPRKSYKYLNEKFGIQYPNTFREADAEPKKLTPKEIRDADMTIVQQPFDQNNPNGYEVASAFTFLTDNMTEGDRMFFQELGLMDLGSPATKGNININKFFKTEDVDVMKAMELPSMDRVKNFNKRQ